MVKFSFSDTVFNFQMLMYLWTSFFIRDVTSDSDKACSHHFNHKVHKCMGPFLDLYELHRQPNSRGPRSDDILIKHLCFEYEKMLQCIHSSLSTCPTLKNVQRVQHKLGADWVMGVNQLCRIQSRGDEEDDIEDEMDDKMDYLPNSTSQNSDTVDNRDINTEDRGLTPSTGNEIPDSRNIVQDGNENIARVKRVQNVARNTYSESENIDVGIYNIVSSYRSSSAGMIQWSVMSLSWTVTMFGSILLNLR